MKSLLERTQFTDKEILYLIYEVCEYLKIMTFSGNNNMCPDYSLDCFKNLMRCHW